MHNKNLLHLYKTSAPAMLELVFCTTTVLANVSELFVPLALGQMLSIAQLGAMYAKVGSKSQLVIIFVQEHYRLLC